MNHNVIVWTSSQFHETIHLTNREIHYHFHWRCSVPISHIIHRLYRCVDSQTKLADDDNVSAPCKFTAQHRTTSGSCFIFYIAFSSCSTWLKIQCVCAMHSCNRLTMEEEETMSGNLICKTAMLIWHDEHLNNVALKNVFEILIKLLRLIHVRFSLIETTSSWHKTVIILFT